MSFVPAPGTIVAQRYQLTRVLGEGGMGVVWAATHTVTRSQVALKLPHDWVRPAVRRRFLREARAIAAVEHPNIVRVHDAFELDDGTPVIVMDLFEGETFGSLLARKQCLPLDEAARVLLAVVSAVGTAHARGIVHRDLKPENVFLANIGGERVVKVLDFGIAKLDSIEDGHSLTTTGSTMGTPCYMSPEQALGEKDIDHRTDIWAIGVMLYEALCGGRPVEGDNLGQVLKHLLTDAITPIGVAVPNLPADVQSLVDRMLARDRAQRLDDLREAKHTLSIHCALAVPSFGPPRSQASSDGAGVPNYRDIASSDGDTLESRVDEGRANHENASLAGPPTAIPREPKRFRTAAILAIATVSATLIIAWATADRRRSPSLPISAGDTDARVTSVVSESAAPPPAAASPSPVASNASPYAIVKLRGRGKPAGSIAAAPTSSAARHAPAMP